MFTISVQPRDNLPMTCGNIGVTHNELLHNQTLSVNVWKSDNIEKLEDLTITVKIDIYFFYISRIIDI